ncbi:EamA family transporter [Myceligenerans xiligouense]|uniref:O-acetylserine/cysteine efflux transporter n=1 Tax=Myceligenerans xiligouense TaxID=253184 RepID=A0A3N4YJT7_9MICO|nr:EamA family transporter [Myceligenerans xiligouense]RPF21389.1 O-acetylserine/cysteine efflux transporter [Myceligenerans xiligouense]
MPLSHRLLAFSVALMWGLNFIAINASLQQFPPFLLVALRFAVVAIPTLLLVPRPQVPVKWLIGYGAGFGTLQFLFLYWGMAAGFPTGLASLVLQSSAPFTVLLGATVFRERVSGRQLAGLGVATAGLAVVGWQQAQAAAFAPFLLVLAGGLGWAIGNVSNARAMNGAGPRPDPLHVTLWMSVVPPVPMALLSLVVEGPTAIARSFAPGPELLPALVGLAYTVVIGTLVGSGIWTWLMARHPAGMVAPFSMLVPVVGLSASALLLGEELGVPQVTGAALVIAGVLWGSRARHVRPVALSAPRAAVAPGRSRAAR